MKKFIIFLLGMTLLFGVTEIATATPLLQLDISDGIYDSSGEDVVSTSDDFTLYSLINPVSGQYDPEMVNHGWDFNVSVALVPQTTSEDEDGKPNLDFGSFVMDGVTYVFTDMKSGNPGIQEHGIFDTYYMEHTFTFTGSNRASDYNVEDNPGGLVVSDTGPLYFESFAVNTSGLDPGYAIHFDLYNDSYGSVVAGKYFAPFSHDAQSGGGNGAPIPEPATMLLLGTGLIGLAGIGRKKLMK